VDKAKVAPAPEEAGSAVAVTVWNGALFPTSKHAW